MSISITPNVPHFHITSLVIVTNTLYLLTSSCQCILLVKKQNLNKQKMGNFMCFYSLHHTVPPPLPQSHHCYIDEYNLMTYSVDLRDKLPKIMISSLKFDIFYMQWFVQNIIHSATLHSQQTNKLPYQPTNQPNS
jgi:hypothetical protein